MRATMARIAAAVRRRTLWRGLSVLAGLGLLALGVAAVNGQGRSAPAARRDDVPTFIYPGADTKLWAVLIGVDQYQDPSIGRAEFAERDAQLLAGTLQKRGAVTGNHLLLMTDSSPADLRPTRANITSQVKRFLGRAGEGDHVLVYFAGHGFLDPAGKKTYLAPIDCDHERLADTGVPLAGLRKALENCDATGKLLVLDACHAGGRDLGGSRDLDAPRNIVRLSDQDVKGEMEEAEGVFTLANCQKEQKSWSLAEKRQGLFTFWLDQGMQGAADGNQDGKITAQELFQFVQPVIRLATKGAQVPASIVGPKVPADLEVLQLQPEKASAALERLARQVHSQCLARGVKRLGVAEFVRSLGRNDRRDNFGHTAAWNVTKDLQKWTVGKADYQVMDPDVVTTALGAKAGPEDLKKLDRLNELHDRAKMDALLMGTFVQMPGRRDLVVNAKLVSADTADVLATPTAVIDVEASPDLDMFITGDSGQVPPDKVIPPLDQIRTPRLRAWMDEVSHKPHPLFDPDCPYWLAILGEDGRAKPFHYNRDDPSKVFVYARPGEHFEIYVANRTAVSSGYSGYGSPYPYSGGQAGGSRSGGYSGDVFVRLWVDGLNVLDQAPEMPEDAWPWVFPPQSDKVIKCWHHYQSTGNGQQAFEGGRFQFVDPPQSLAYHKGFKEDVGRVTAFFYAATEMNWLRKLGVSEDENVKLRVLYPSGRGNEQLCLAYPLAWITIYYVRDPNYQPEDR